MNQDILYSEALQGLKAEHLTGFFEAWPGKPTPATHLRLLERSAHVVLARAGEEGRVVGFVTALSDGVLAAYIPLLEVLPEYRGQGIGRGLVERMLVLLSELYMIDLSCDEALRPFYEGHGMAAGTAMMLRNYANQSGAA